VLNVSFVESDPEPTSQAWLGEWVAKWRPYSKGQKNDFRDAEAIAEADIEGLPFDMNPSQANALTQSMQSSDQAAL